MTLHVDVPAAAEMSQLEFFTGVREGTGTFFATDTEPAIIQPVLRVHAQFCHRGHWLRQEFEWVERPEADPAASALVRATRIWGYDRAAHRFVSEWFDSRGRRATVTSPGWTGESLVASAVVLMAGQELHARETFERQGDREWRHRAEVDAGDGWVPGEEQVLRRI